MSTLRRSIWVTSFVLCACAVVACAADSDGGPDLNPQPLPPGQPAPEPSPEDPSRGTASDSPESSGAFDNGKGAGGGSSGSSGTSSSGGPPPPAPQQDGGTKPNSWQLYQLVPKRD